MKIGGFIKFSLIDYPGKIAATIFTQGCNYRCLYCHNADLVLPEKFQEAIPEVVIFNFLQQRKGQIESVVITGGEPTLQAGLEDFLIKIKALGYSVKLDTNGSYPDILKNLLYQKLVDYIAMDIKAPWQKYDKVTGVRGNLEAVKESVRLIAESGVAHEFRSTVVKSLLSYDDIQQMGSLIPPGSVYNLHEFVPRKDVVHPLYAKPQNEHYSRTELQQIQASFHGPVCA